MTSSALGEIIFFSIKRLAMLRTAGFACKFPKVSALTI